MLRLLKFWFGSSFAFFSHNNFFRYLAFLNVWRNIVGWLLFHSEPLSPSFVCITIYAESHSDISLTFLFEVSEKIFASFFLVFVSLLRFFNIFVSLFLIRVCFYFFKNLLLFTILFFPLLLLFLFYINPIIFIILNLFMRMILFRFLWPLLILKFTIFLRTRILLRLFKAFLLIFWFCNQIDIFVGLLWEKIFLKLVKFLIGTVTFHHVNKMSDLILLAFLSFWFS